MNEALKLAQSIKTGTIERLSKGKTSEDEKLRAVRKQAIRQFVRWLTGNGSNPERIWKRAKTVQFMFEKEEGFPRLLNLANELNTSSASISRNLAAYEAELESVYVNQSRPENSLQ